MARTVTPPRRCRGRCAIWSHDVQCANSLAVTVSGGFGASKMISQLFAAARLTGVTMKIIPQLVSTILLVSAPLASVAQDQGSADERQACEPDVRRLCSEAGNDKDKIIVCLNQKVRQLSPPCRSVMLFYAQQQICSRDSNRLCGEFAEDRGRTFACMSEKVRMLSPSCRKAFEVYARQRQ
jgi:hypothetical protein